nr:acyltransferase [uncultured Anaerostipes sp.]
MNTMQNKSGKNLYYPGMFDFIKGIAMISIVMTHAQFALGEEAFATGSDWILKLFGVIGDATSFGNAAMPMFLLVSGYGFRKTKDNWKCVKKQAKLLLKPFAFAACLTTVLHLCVHYAAFRYFPGSIRATIGVGLGYLLGASNTFYIGGITVCSVGAVWFLGMLFWGWIALNFIMNKVNEKHLPWLMALILVIGRLLCFLPPIPYCLVQGVIAIPYLYMGWMIKKHELLTKKFSPVIWGIMIVGAIWSSKFGLLRISDPYVRYGILELICDGFMAFLVMWIGLRINRFQFPLKSCIGMIGRYSLWIMCLHTIEQQALPWYLLYERLGMLDNWMLYLISLALKTILIYIGYRFLIWNDQRKIKKKREMRRHRHV